MTTALAQLTSWTARKTHAPRRSVARRPRRRRGRCRRRISSGAARLVSGVDHDEQRQGRAAAAAERARAPCRMREVGCRDRGGRRGRRRGSPASGGSSLDGGEQLGDSVARLRERRRGVASPARPPDAVCSRRPALAPAAHLRRAPPGHVASATPPGRWPRPAHRRGASRAVRVRPGEQLAEQLRAGQQLVDRCPGRRSGRRRARSPGRRGAAWSSGWRSGWWCARASTSLRASGGWRARCGRRWPTWRRRGRAPAGWPARPGPGRCAGAGRRTA